MAAPVIAVATEDFEVYHDLARHLRLQGVVFETLVPGDQVPSRIEVVVTTASEASSIPHDNVVEYTTPRGTLEAVMSLIKGLEPIDHLVIGVDPGQRPGVAVVADGHVLSSRQVASPEEVARIVERTVDRFSSHSATVRVGHGAATHRDRIVNALLDAGYEVELVDETSTSPPRSRLHGERDAVAARAIALTRGTPVRTAQPIQVPPGEVRDIQRRSRLASEGKVTISKELARRVARGLLSLSEAVHRQEMKGLKGQP